MTGNPKILIWLIIISVFSLIFITFSVINISGDFSRQGQDIPVTVCESVECDEISEYRLDYIVLPAIVKQKQHFIINNTLIASLQLSPVIFQPPEKLF